GQLFCHCAVWWKPRTGRYWTLPTDSQRSPLEPLPVGGAVSRREPAASEALRQAARPTQSSFLPTFLITCNCNMSGGRAAVSLWRLAPVPVSMALCVRVCECVCVCVRVRV
ncbi:hypothetical protein H1C71_008037, partial [Ictidomys tridecemlineatus]